MRYGCCMNLVAAAPGGIGGEKLRALGRSGFDFAELPLSAMMLISGPDFFSLQDKLRRAGLSCDVCGSFFPRIFRLTGEEADEAAELNYARKALERAAALGASVVTFGNGGLRSVPAGFSPKRAYAQLVSLLQKLGPMADAHGITLAIEPFRRAETNLINSFTEACRLAGDTGCPNVRAMADLYHMAAERESPEVLRTLGPQYLAHVHFCNPKNRAFPASPEEADYGPFAAALEWYRGRVSCEAYSNAFETDAPRALACMRTLFGG